MEKNNKNGKITKKMKFLNRFIALELRFTMKNYYTVEKTMVLWKKLWYYSKL